MPCTPYPIVDHRNAGEKSCCAGELTDAVCSDIIPKSASMALKAKTGLHVTSPLGLEYLRSSGLPIIVDHGDDSCIPCKEMVPVLEDLNRTLAGMAMIFTALGAVASHIGRLSGMGTSGWWYLVLGLLMVAMALQTWGVIIIPSSYAQNLNKRRGYAGAFVTGILGGLFSSPCATPVLIALLALVARESNPAWGILLLLLYSAGHSLLVVIAGTFMGLSGKATRSDGYHQVHTGRDTGTALRDRGPVPVNRFKDSMICCCRLHHCQLAFISSAGKN